MTSFFRRCCLRVGSLLVLVLFAALLAAGCSSGTPVRISSEPGGALLTVREVNGSEVDSGASPLNTSLGFDEDQAYEVTARPAAGDDEYYKPITVRLTQDDLVRVAGEGDEAGDADDADTAASFVVQLPQRESVMLPAWVPVYHPRDGWTAVRTRMRSYRTVVEANGRAPEQVAALSPVMRSMAGAVSADADFTELGVGVWGLDVSDIDGGRLVTSVFAAGDPVRLPTDDPESAALIAAAERRGRDPDAPLPESIPSRFRHNLEAAQIVALRLPGLAEERVTTSRYADLMPAFSSDGEYLFFASNRDAADRSDIFRLPSVRRGALDVVTRNLPNGGATDPSQAENGTVVFCFLPASAQSLEDAQVYAKIGGLTGYDSLIVQSGAQPRISPDGQQIAYVSDGDLWLCSTDGSAQRRLTIDGPELIELYEQTALPKSADQERFAQFEADWMTPATATPDWSPDGQRIAYASLAGVDDEGRPNYDIYLIDLQGRRQQITTNGSVDLFPRFSPDGRWLYFLSNRGLQWAVWRLPVPDATE